MTDIAAEPDVVDVLSSDHQEFLQLIEEIKLSVEAEARRDLAVTLISELVRHAVAEEMYVYPAMRKHLPDGDDAIKHDTAEHKELEQTMKTLEAADAVDAEFLAIIDELETTLRDHVRDEESDQFPSFGPESLGKSW